MAEEILLSNDVLLYIDTTTPTTTAIDAVTIEDFVLVACLTDNSFNGTTSTLESASKCAGNFGETIADKITWSMDFTGEHLKNAGLNGRLSAEEIQQLWLDKKTFWAAQYDIAENSVVYGLARIDSFTKTAGANSIATFSATLTGIGGVGTKATLAPVTP